MLLSEKFMQAIEKEGYLNVENITNKGRIEAYKEHARTDKNKERLNILEKTLFVHGLVVFQTESPNVKMLSCERCKNDVNVLMKITEKSKEKSKELVCEDCALVELTGKKANTVENKVDSPKKEVKGNAKG